MTKTLLTESSSGVQTGPDGTYKIVLITPGQGSSAYYTEELLREYGPATFPAGTHSYPTHQKAQDRNPFTMIGGLAEDAFYEDGVGLVGYLKPRESLRETLEEIKDYVGFSISAPGECEEAEVDGQVTKVATSLIPSITNTVDLVSYAGRGGKFAMAESLLEEALTNSHTDSTDENPGKGNGNMPTLEEKVESLISVVESLVTKFDEALAGLETEKNTVAESAADASKAVDAADAVAKADIPESVKESLREGIKAGNYDVQARIDETVKLLEEDRQARKDKAENLEESLFGGVVNSKDDSIVSGW